MDHATVLRTRCCIAGGGPAGMMLGYLLARAGVDVVVLEKHADFLRDFRGDTIHPSTLAVMDELGLLDAFLARPHDEMRELSGTIGGVALRLADFRHVPGRCKFIAFMPQWDFLTFLAEQARAFPRFHLEMNAEVMNLVYDGARVAGVEVRTPEGARTIYADLVIGADGRTSTVRALAGLTIADLGAPIDVLWMRLPRAPDDQGQTFGTIAPGKILVLIDRHEYYQAAFVIPKGGFAQIQDRGLPAFRASLLALAPFLRDRVEALRTWDDIRLLTVRVDRLRCLHRDGLLCIGDAAHAMSPIGGVGINLAIQDAVAAANVLAIPLRTGRPAEDALARVQRRRELPTRLTQRLQIVLQQRVIGRVLESTKPIAPPALIRALGAVPLLRRIPAFVVGVGFRPEHVRTPRLP